MQMQKQTQTQLVLATGILVAAIAVFANYKIFGFKPAVWAFIIVGLITELTIREVQCLEFGQCISTSWIATAIFIVTFLNIGYTYLYVIWNKAWLSNKELIGSHPFIGPALSAMHKYLNINPIR
jgi:hypothetical protein